MRCRSSSSSSTPASLASWLTWALNAAMAACSDASMSRLAGGCHGVELALSVARRLFRCREPALGLLPAALVAPERLVAPATLADSLGRLRALRGGLSR